MTRSGETLKAGIRVPFVMRLGYSITSRHPLDVPSNTAASTILERATAAREAGFDYVQVGDHHVVAEAHYFQNVPTMARLAAVFDHIGGMFLLPLHNPILLSEQVGTVAAFAERIDVWCAVGYVEREFEAFGIPLAERGDRFEEFLALARRLWTEDEVTHHGVYYSVDGVGINPKTNPRICIGGSAEVAVRRAGRLGDAWVIAPYVESADFSRKLDWFEDAGGGEVLLRRDALLLYDGEEARTRASALLKEGYRGWSQEDEDRLLIGGPEDAAAELERYRELGVDEVVIRPMHGDFAVDTFDVLAGARDRID